MNQNEYLKSLKRNLSPLDKAERNRIAEYYAELIGDKIESGISEGEILSKLGSPQELAKQIISETQESSAKPGEKIGKLSVGRIVGFSLLIPFAILAPILLYVFALSFALTALSCLLGGTTLFIGSFVVMTSSIAAGLFQLGITLAAISCGIFIGFGTWKFILLCGKVTSNILSAYKKTYTREASAV